jgi:hypothetical protein
MSLALRLRNAQSRPFGGTAEALPAGSVQEAPHCARRSYGVDGRCRPSPGHRYGRARRPEKLAAPSKRAGIEFFVGMDGEENAKAGSAQGRPEAPAPPTTTQRYATRCTTVNRVGAAVCFRFAAAETDHIAPAHSRARRTPRCSLASHVSHDEDRSRASPRLRVWHSPI